MVYAADFAPEDNALDATLPHPAQVEVYYEDVTVGHWRTVKFSGALPASQVKALRARVERLQEAVRPYRTPAGLEFPGVSLVAAGRRA